MEKKIAQRFLKNFKVFVESIHTGIFTSIVLVLSIYFQRCVIKQQTIFLMHS